MNESILGTIEQYKIIAIMRNVPAAAVIAAAEALYSGGIRLLEITFNQKSNASDNNTAEAIHNLRKHFEQRMRIGAGTVMSIKQANVAIDAGAEYIISPNVNLDVISKTIERQTVSLPGAFTPSEIAMAYEAGASAVKIFPLGDVGINYIKAIRAPLSHIPMIAVGGVSESNMKDYLAAGAIGVGIGSHIVDNELISQGKYDELIIKARKFTNQI